MYDQWFGYGGNGAGLVFFSVHENPNVPSRGPNLGTAFFRPLDEAIDVALATTNPQLGVERNSQLKTLLLDNVVALPTESIVSDLKDETYRDILDSSVPARFPLAQKRRTLPGSLGWPWLGQADDL